MEPGSHPVLRYLAVARAARDFGLAPAELDALALHHRSADDFAEAAADAVLAGHEPPVLTPRDV